MSPEQLRASSVSAPIAVALASCTRASRTDSPASGDISLMPVPDSAPERYAGLTNIFVAARRLRSLFAARYKASGDTPAHLP